MVDDPAYVRAFKDFVGGDLTIKELPELEAEVHGLSDRASAILLGSILESSLTTFLSRKLRPELNKKERKRLFDYEGPLGTLSAKIMLAYAMELIGPVTRHDLDLIRLLRNGFAHSRRHIDFDTPQTAAVCKHLKYPDLPGAFMQFTSLERAAAELGKADLAKSGTRYRIACHTISSRLIKNVSRLQRLGPHRMEPPPQLP